MSEDRYIVSVVRGHEINPGAISRSRRPLLATPCEASVLDRYNMHLPVAVFTSSGGGSNTPGHAIERAEKECRLRNLAERAAEATLDDDPDALYGYMCEGCLRNVLLTREQFDERDGRVRCDDCS